MLFVGSAWVLRSWAQLEDFFDRNVEDARDAVGEQQRGHVLVRFKGDDRLARYAGLLGQFLLCHFAVVEPKTTDLVRDFMLQRRPPPSGREPERQSTTPPGVPQLPPYR